MSPAEKAFAAKFMDNVIAKNPAEPEFHQAVQEVAESLALVLERHPEYRHGRILERIIEPSLGLLHAIQGETDTRDVIGILPARSEPRSFGLNRDSQLRELA